VLDSHLPLASILLEGSAPGFSAAEGPDLTRYLLICGALIAVVGLVGWGFRRLFARSLEIKAAKRSMQVMDVLPLGGKHRLAVVRCYDRTFLLGVGEREVCLVSELDGVIKPDAVPLAPAPEREDFSRNIGRLLQRDAPAPIPAAPRAEPRRGVLQPGGILG
jgi:flagellar biogenesis protein FliO